MPSVPGAAWGAAVAILALSMPLPSAAEQASAERVLGEEQSITRQAAGSQQRIDELDEQALALWTTYQTELRHLEDLEAYNRNLRAMLDSQSREQQTLAQEIREIEAVRRDLLPMMLDMLSVLEEFVTLDKPFLPEERGRRLESLREVMSRSDVDIAEKYRRLVEAYLIEAEYGQSIEAYEGPVMVDGQELMVDFLRVGRVGLYYLSLDRGRAGIWNPHRDDWEMLAQKDVEHLEQAIRVARRQAPPDLLNLPVWTPESGR